jgi:hypothetical protein
MWKIKIDFPIFPYPKQLQMNRIFLLLFAFNMLLISSCTIQKRLHQRGFAVSSNVSFPTLKKKVKPSEDSEQQATIQYEEQILAVSSDNTSDIAYILPSPVQENVQIVELIPKDTLKPANCDEIVLSTGEVVKGERLVQLNQKVYYTPCGSKTTERPFVLEKLVHYVRYANGKSDTINQQVKSTFQTAVKSDRLNRTKSGLAITSIILASIGIPGLILFGYGGILGLIGLIFGIAAGDKKGGVVEKRTRRFVVWGIVLSILVLLFGLVILTMWIG